MKAFSIVAATILILTLFMTSCRSSSVIEENGEYFLSVSCPTEATANDSGLTMVACVVFDSVDEMMHAINNSDFTEHELKQVSRFPRDEQGRIRLFDPSEVYIPVGPAEFDGESVVWSGPVYSTMLTCSSNNLSASFSCETNKGIETAIDKIVNFQLADPDIPVTTTYRDNGNTTIYQYQTSFGDYFTIMYYTIEQEERTLHIIETYNTNESFPTIPPFEVEIIADCHNGQCFIVSIQGFNEIPSVDWLTQFYITKYTG